MTAASARTSKWPKGALALVPELLGKLWHCASLTWAARVRVLLGFPLIAAGAVFNPVHAQSYSEFEPNNSCAGAQSLVGASLPLRVEGYKTQPYGDAVDYFRFGATPGSVLRVTLSGDPSSSKPLTAFGVGLFSSDCPSSPSASSFTIFTPANLGIVVPPDGIFIIGVTACCDGNFSGSGTVEGAYLLSVDPILPVLSVKSIIGSVTDRLTGVALPGASEPFARVELYRSGLFGLEYVAGMPTSNEGRYVFSTETVGRSLTPGDYQVVAYASQYQSTDSAVDLSNVQGGETRVAPTLALLSNPVRFTDIKPCEDLPAQGGDCNFSYRVTVGSSGRLAGGVWSLVDAWGTGGMINATQFLACEHPIALSSGTRAASHVVHCRFTVPGAVPDYAFFCVDARFGEGSRANPHFAVQGLIDPLFCLSKLPAQTSLKVVPGEIAAQHMQRSRGHSR